MRIAIFDKSSIPLLAILLLLAGLVVLFGISLRSDAVDEAVKSDRILNVLFVVDLGGKPVSTELFLFYPATGRGAVLDVPGETGLIIKSLNRVDRIDALFKDGRIKPYIDEIARLLAAEVPYYIVLDATGLAIATDLLEGLELFLPQAIDSPGPPPVRLPSGALVLDGDKVVQYASYVEPDEGDADTAARRQKLFQALIRRLGERSSWIARSDVFPVFKRSFKTNLTDDAFRRFVKELARLDADKLVLQRITGAWRIVDGKRLLFPHYDGELVRDIVKQTLNALSNSTESGVADKIFTVEILNGTPEKGLAKKTAEIFQSFGYDVITVGNANREDLERTQIIDRYANSDAAKNVAAVIRCENLSRVEGVAPGEAVADFTVILGKDFNGRYCIAP